MRRIMHSWQRIFAAIAIGTTLGLATSFMAAPAHADYSFRTPTSLVVVDSSGTALSLDWASVSGAKMYRVQISDRSSMAGASYHRFTATKGTITGLKSATRYYYRVAVIDPKTGGKLSDYTPKTYPSSMTRSVAAGYAYPVPLDLTVTGSTPTSLSLDWDTVTDAPMYRVQYSTYASMSRAKYLGANESEATLTGLAPDTTYYVRVAVVEAGNGAKLGDYTQKPYTTGKTTAPIAGGYEYPIPVNLRSTEATSSSLSMVWERVPNAPMYRVQYSKNASMSSASYAGFTTSGGTLTGLSAKTTYYVRVAVVKAGNGSKLSDYTGKPYVTAVTEEVTPPTGGPSDLNVASFNLFGANNDVNASGETRIWSERKPVVVSQIVDEDLDIIGTQEAYQGLGYSTGGVAQYTDLRNGLNAAGKPFEVTDSSHYNCKRSTSPSSCEYVDQGASNGTRILYNTATVRMLDSGSFKYANQASGYTDRYFAWATFEQVASGKKVFFADTHLSPNSESVRKAEWHELIDGIDNLNTADLPVIVVGDFNTSKFKTIAAEMLPAMKSAGFGDVMNQEYRVNPPRSPRAAKVVNGWINSYNQFRRDTTPYSYSDHNKVGNGIDWIFATNSLPVKQWKVVIDVDPKTSMINGIIPSDHNMLSSTVVLP